ncbi:hypothetical protein Tco_1471128, partial [Tanacetum coccineum]
MEPILEDEDAMDKGVADKLKKRKPDDDRDKGPPTGPDQGLKRKKTDKETKPSKKTSQNQLASLHKQRRQCLRLEILKCYRILEKTRVILMNHPLSMLIQMIGSRNRKDLLLQILNGMKISDLTQDILVGPAYELLKGTCRSYVKLDYNMEECYKTLTDQLDWNNPKGDRYPFNLSKPLPLVKSGNHQIIPIDYFFNNDLAYLQGESTGRTYTTSLTKTKAAKYNLKGIEDMVPNLWSLIKVAYDKHALLGTSHWGPKRQRLYGYASKMVSKYDVYSTKRILAMKNVKINVWYGYAHLEEIEVRRSDQNLYMFMEGNIPRLHLNDIEDMQRTYS